MSSSDAYENGKNGKSFWRQAYTSPFEGIAHADDEAARAAANAASTSTIPYYRPAPTNVSVCSDGGGTSSGDAGTVTSTVIGWVVAIIVLGGIFGGGDKKDSMSTTRTAVAHDATTTTALSGRQATANREALIWGVEAATRDATPVPTAFREGAADRHAWETWFVSLRGDYRDGAFFWSAVRSNPNPGSCLAGRGHTSDAYRWGCVNAQKFLTQVDARRTTEPGYWRGWNSY
jgi:hypothetical protein